ncbi:odorant-binding protein 2a isoform X2 [Desmodus rotundus]|uniref:odorant-binding protein 2a isoform X2 n=1 Tax=Desmodus rotundus TaxID=9430 RepID=UPI0039E6CEEA
MKVLALTIVFGLITALQALDPLSLALEGQNITGTWYVKAVVADKGLFKEKRPKAVSPVMLDVLDGGYLEASFTFLKKGQCHEVKVVMHSTEEPGKFSLWVSLSRHQAPDGTGLPSAGVRGPCPPGGPWLVTLQGNGGLGQGQQGGGAAAGQGSSGPR